MRNVAGLLLQRETQNVGHRSRELLDLAESRAASWDIEEQRCHLPKTTRSTFLMAFSHDGTKIASAHGDHKIYVSDVKSGKCLHTLSGHPRTPWCLAFHPTFGDVLASGCLGGEVRVWDLHGGCEVWADDRKMTIASLAFHPTDQVLVVATGNEIYFWDWSRERPFARCKTASDRERVKLVRFDRYGHRLFTGIVNAREESAAPPQQPQQQPPPQREEECAILQRYLSTLREQHQQLLICLQGLRNSSAGNPPPPSPPTAAQERRVLAEPVEFHVPVGMLVHLIRPLEEGEGPPRPAEGGSPFQRATEFGGGGPRPREFLLELQSLQRWYARECQRIRELLIARSWTQVRDRAAAAAAEPAEDSESEMLFGAARRGYEPQAVLQTRLSIQHIRNARNIMATILLLNRIQDAFRAHAISQISRVLERELAGLIDHICAMLCELASHGNGSLGFLRRVALRLVHACRRRLGTLPRAAGSARDEMADAFGSTSASSGEWFPGDPPPASDLPGSSGLRRQSAAGYGRIVLGSRGEREETSSARRLTGRNFALYGNGEGSAFQTFQHAPEPESPDQEDVTESLIRTDHMLRMIVEDLQGLLRYISGSSTSRHPADQGSHSDDENRETRPRFQDPRDQFLWDRLRNIRSRAGMGSSEHSTLNRTTYRLQCWDFSKCRVPDISDGEANVVVRECLIQNDACVDISSDGRLLAAFLPGRVSTLTFLGIHSLEPETMGQCLYLWNFRSNVISVSLSPMANYVLVGMGSTRRLTLERDGKLIIGDILQLVNGNGDREDYLQMVRTVEVNVEEQADCSLNSTRWLPIPGQGFMYGTNRGELKICRPKGPSRVRETRSPPDAPSFWAPRRTYREIMDSVYAPRALFGGGAQSARALFQETRSRGTQTEPSASTSLS